MKFIVAAPRYNHQSAGIVVLHELCDALCRLGHECYIILMHGSAPNFDWAYTNSEEFFNKELKRTSFPDGTTSEHINLLISQSIIFYPEVVSGNPLNGRNVIRYFLNYDGGLSGHPVEIKERDLIITYQHDYKPDAVFRLFKPILTIRSYDDYFYNLNLNKVLELTYFGKNPLNQETFRIKDTVSITKTWPDTKDQLLTLLKATKYFYTWDCHTTTALDALLCGATPIALCNSNDISIPIIENFPYIKGVATSNKSVELIEDDVYSFEARREAYINKIFDADVQFHENLKVITDAAFIHFEIKDH